MTQRGLSLLMSKMAAERFGARVQEIMTGHPYRLMHLDDAPDSTGDFGVDIGLITLDVRGDYGTGRSSPTMLRFFEMAHGSRNLQWVHANSAGADRPDYGQLRERNVTVTTSSGATDGAVALSALGGIVALARHFPQLMDSQRRRAWEPLRGDRTPRDIPGQTAVVVGMGPIGQEIARLLKALRLHVIGVRRSRSPLPNFDETVSYDDLHRVLPSADWVVLACPLTETTRDLMDAKAFSLLPPGARLINVARGDVVNENDLIAALSSGKLDGAYLDVFHKEPLDNESPLWSMPNVMVSPHSSSYSIGQYDRIGDIFLENLALWRDGRPMRNVWKP
jgi:D-2-hydroxyacid dehydrogenase (NADP+)